MVDMYVTSRQTKDGGKRRCQVGSPKKKGKTLPSEWWSPERQVRCPGSDTGQRDGGRVSTQSN